MLGRILHDEKGRLPVGDMVVAAAAGPGADRDFVEQVRAVKERLAELQEVAFAAQLDAEFLAHRAGAAVAADEIGGAEARCAAVPIPHCRGDAFPVLFKGQELAAVAHGHARQRLGDGFQERLERVLRDELIRLERQRAVVAMVDLGPRLRHRRIRQVQERRLVHGEHDEDVHGDAAVEPGRADLLGKAHAPIDLHGAGVAALHLGQELGRLLLLDEGAADALEAERDGERQPDRPCPDDQNLRVGHSFTCCVRSPAARWRRVSAHLPAGSQAAVRLSRA